MRGYPWSMALFGLVALVGLALVPGAPPAGAQRSLSAAEQPCAQWEIDGWWDMKVDNYDGKPYTGRIDFRQTGTTIRAAVFFGDSELSSPGVGSLIGNRLSFGIGVRDPYSKVGGGGPSQTWNGTVTETSISGSGEQFETQWSRPFEFTWSATQHLPAGYQQARCVASATPVATVAPVPQECRVTDLNRLLDAGPVRPSDLYAILGQSEKAEQVLDEGSIAEAMEMRRERDGQQPGTGEIAAALSFNAALRYRDGEGVYPTLHTLLPVLQTMLRIGERDPDALTAAGRLVVLSVLIDRGNRCGSNKVTS